MKESQHPWNARSAEVPPAGILLVLTLVAVRAALPLLLIHPAWEFHRDEFLYFAMGDHLDVLRMQFPPFIAIVARTGRALFGDSVLAARVPAALGGAAVLGTMLWLCRRLGGGAVALFLVTLASMAAPVFVRTSVLMHPVVFDQLWATLAISAVVLAAVEQEPRWWLLAGLALGLGGLTKFSAAFYGACIGATAVLVPSLRAQLRTRWPWLGALVALGLVIPSISGQVVHGWPFLKQMDSLRSGQLAQVSASAFLGEQPLMLGAASMLVVVGVLAALRGDLAARVAMLVLGFLLFLLLVMHGKSYYAAPAYPAVIAVAAAWVTRGWFSRARADVTNRPGVRQTWQPRLVFGAMAMLLVAGALVLLPLGVPLLAPDAMARYAARLGAAPATQTNRGEQLALPQDYADMLGWRAMADSVHRVVQGLSPAERARLIVTGSNYGEAGALAMYRERFDLPYAVSVHGDFHAWGVDTSRGTDAVVVLLDRPDAFAGLREFFTTVEVAATIGEPRAVPEERELRIYVARGPRQPLARLWPTLGPRWD